MQDGEAEVLDVTLGGDDEVVGFRRLPARGSIGSQLGMTSEGLAEPTLDPIADDRVADLLRDRETEPRSRRPAREELEDEARPVDAVTLPLDPEELGSMQDSAFLGERLADPGRDEAPPGHDDVGRDTGQGVESIATTRNGLSARLIAVRRL